MTATSGRPQYFKRRNGEKAVLPFTSHEYDRRLADLRKIMAVRDIPAVVLTSMHNIAYYSGFLYCAFGRQFACVVTGDKRTTITANIDAGQPWRRSHGDNIIYTDWQHGNFWEAVRSVVGHVARVGFEADHMTVTGHKQLEQALGNPELVDIAGDAMQTRMIKSAEEQALIRSGAEIADHGGAVIRSAIRVGAREIDVAMAGRDAMELAIAERHPNSELRDTWVWFQSGINTDGAHNPVTTRRLRERDLLSLNAFPMISGYYTALERTLFLGEPDKATLRLWETNVMAHELGLSLIRPGATCSGICQELNRLFADEGVLQYRSFGYGHSFGLLSHYYGREAGLELREDNDTVLQPGMVLSMEPMLWVPDGQAGAGGYREHDILILTEDGAENITRFPYGPAANVLAA